MKGMLCAALTLVVLLGATEHVQASELTDKEKDNTEQPPPSKEPEVRQESEKEKESPIEKVEKEIEKEEESEKEKDEDGEKPTEAPTPPPWKQESSTTTMPTTTTDWMHGVPHDNDWWKWMLGVGAGMIGAVAATAGAIALSHVKPVKALSSPQVITGVHAQVAAKTGHFIANDHYNPHYAPPVAGQLPGGEGVSTDGLNYRKIVGHPLVPLYDNPDQHGPVAYPQANMRGGSINGYVQGEGYNRKFTEKPAQLEITDSYEAGKAFGQKYFGTVVFAFVTFSLVLFAVARVWKARRLASHSHADGGYSDVTRLTQEVEEEETSIE